MLIITSIGVKYSIKNTNGFEENIFESVSPNSYKKKKKKHFIIENIHDIYDNVMNSAHTIDPSDISDSSEEETDDDGESHQDLILKTDSESTDVDENNLSDITTKTKNGVFIIGDDSDKPEYSDNTELNDEQQRIKKLYITSDFDKQYTGSEAEDVISKMRSANK